MHNAETDQHHTDVDLTNCDREPIHILGQVQGYGCLIAVSADWMINYASENCVDLLGLTAQDIIGSRFSDLFARDTVHDFRSKMQILSTQTGSARMFRYPVMDDGRLFDISISQSGQSIIFEFEPSGTGDRKPIDRSTVRALIERVKRRSKIDEMAREAVRAIAVMSGFDRVMAYRFNADDTGTVIAEVCQPDQDSYLGLRYPASDIPKQARALYLRSPLRIIADVNATTYAIHPPRDPHGQPLDLSLAVTRAVSPIHLEYLRNMGVAASMSVSIIRNGKLWGLFACHHRTPRYIDFELRSEIELFSELFNYQLAQVELTEELAETDRARGLHDRLMTQLSGGRSMAETFDVLSDSIGDVIPFDGAAIFTEGEYKSTGSAPTREEFMGLARFLNTTPPGQVYETNALATRYPAAEGFSDRVAGIMVLPVSRTPRDYLVLFRREIAESVKWAGNPRKPVELGPNGARLTPRKSFEAWREVVHGQSAPWRSAELRAADALRVTLLEVVLKMSDERNAMRRQAQDQQELLVAELNHRVRNILNLIRGLISQGKEDARSLDDYRSVLEHRIYALARAHDQLTQTAWNWVSLRSLVETEIRAFLTNKASRVRITGDEVELSPTAFSTLALVIHELVTNSAKYGALVDASGNVSLDVRMQPDGVAKVAWREGNGPPVQAPMRRGFGTTIIERSIPYELKGKADTRFLVTGFEADFVLPSAHVRPATAVHQAEPDPATQEAKDVQLHGHCLVVEDNMVIALDATDMLSDMGAQHVHTASSVVDGLAVLSKQDITFALLDVNLGDETSVPIIEKCLELGIPAILATGYGANKDLLDRFPTIPVLTKPYDSVSLSRMIATVFAEE